MLKKINSLINLLKDYPLNYTFRYLSKKYFFDIENKIFKHIKKLNNFDSRLYDAHYDSMKYIYTSQVEGDVIEFGVMTGNSSIAFSVSLKFLNDRFKDFKKKILFFDSFKGLPKIENQIDLTSDHVKKKIWYEGGCQGYKETEFKKIIKKNLDENYFTIYNGWFADQVKLIPKDSKFALIHIDSDLYQSCIDSLGYLFENNMISEGTIILFDDYNSNQSSKETGERKAWYELVDKYNIDFTDLGVYAHASNRFIVHNYLMNK